ncbi:RHS repeat-associated core domain-containing protein [Pseudomonas sp.]|uniref:RHS repeat-associated core domain-containing protein n=1 Tax=Pseudomonas sp. TaxID=306 RepID=UPI0028AE2B2F|nr:RHS repeat-associated core domain-containing protein [Pseudomonas sp.]
MADATNRTRYFYQGERLQAVQPGKHSVSFFRDAQRPLVQRDQNAEQGGMLLCDEQDSVLQIAGVTGERVGYSPYGYTPRLPSPDGGLAFNGEFADPPMRAYLLGSYRLYDPALMRFYSPDNESPFQDGGRNAYGYCLSDPVNLRDPTGHNPWRRSSLKRSASLPALKIGISARASRQPGQPEKNVASLPHSDTVHSSEGVLPEVVRYAINSSKYNEIKMRLVKQARSNFELFDKKKITVEEFEETVRGLWFVDNVLETKKAYSMERNLFYPPSNESALSQTIESRNSIVVARIRSGTI